MVSFIHGGGASAQKYIENGEMNDMAYTKPSIRKDLDTLEEMLEALKTGSTLDALEGICDLLESMYEKTETSMDTLNYKDKLSEQQEERLQMLDNLFGKVGDMKGTFDELKETFENMEDHITTVQDLDAEL